MNIYAVFSRKNCKKRFCEVHIYANFSLLPYIKSNKLIYERMKQENKIN